MLEQLRYGIEVMVLPTITTTTATSPIAVVGKVTGKAAEADAMIMVAAPTQGADRAARHGEQQAARPFLLFMGGARPQAAGLRHRRRRHHRLAAVPMRIDGYSVTGHSRPSR